VNLKKSFNIINDNSNKDNIKINPDLNDNNINDSLENNFKYQNNNEERVNNNQEKVNDDNNSHRRDNKDHRDNRDNRPYNRNRGNSNLNGSNNDGYKPTNHQQYIPLEKKETLVNLLSSILTLHNIEHERDELVTEETNAEGVVYCNLSEVTLKLFKLISEVTQYSTEHISSIFSYRSNKYFLIVYREQNERRINSPYDNRNRSSDRRYGSYSNYNNSSNYNNNNYNNR